MKTPRGAGRPSPADAPVILGDVPGSFARGVLEKRHPALIRQVADAFPYPPSPRQRLDELLAEITEGTISPLPATAHDHRQWADWDRGCLGRSWFDVPFLWAESFFYRKLLEAVGYFAPGPWHRIDPFAPVKHAELRTPELDEELAALDQLAGRPADEQATALLHASVWGNQADLGFRLTAGPAAGSGGADRQLVSDDSATLWSLLPEGGRAARVAVIADNAGRELIPDLLLIDHLLRHGHAEAVLLHIKPYPYYLSDAMLADVVLCVRRLTQAPGRASEAGKRLWAAMTTGQLRVHAHPFSCAPLPYPDLPPDLRTELATCSLTLLKGDLNYRRLVGDQLWPPTTSFADRAAGFPTPVVALRTLKSDVITGLTAETVADLDATGTPWRTSGSHALIQARP